MRSQRRERRARRDRAVPQLRAEISHFFSVYKDLDPTRCSEIEGWDDLSAALATIKAARERFAAQGVRSRPSGLRCDPFRPPARSGLKICSMHERCSGRPLRRCVSRLLQRNRPRGLFIVSGAPDAPPDRWFRSLDAALRVLNASNDDWRSSAWTIEYRDQPSIGGISLARNVIHVKPGQRLADEALP